jgi:hypothetical protein
MNFSLLTILIKIKNTTLKAISTRHLKCFLFSPQTLLFIMQQLQFYSKFLRNVITFYERINSSESFLLPAKYFVKISLVHQRYSCGQKWFKITFFRFLSLNFNDDNILLVFMVQTGFNFFVERYKNFKNRLLL